MTIDSSSGSEGLESMFFDGQGDIFLSPPTPFEVSSAEKARDELLAEDPDSFVDINDLLKMARADTYAAFKIGPIATSLGQNPDSEHWVEAKNALADAIYSGNTGKQ